MKVGYRNDAYNVEVFAKSKTRIESVIYFEMNNLYNRDIADYLKKVYNIDLYYNENFETTESEIAKAVEALRKATNKNLTRCLWLCDSVDDLKKVEYVGPNTDNDVQAYKATDVMLSDLGTEGKLYAYTDDEWNHRFIA